MKDMIPGLDDEGLANLHANALRLQDDAPGPRQLAAAELLPLIDAELAGRKATKAAAAAEKRQAAKGKAA